jgi:hypothetical protein
MLEQDPALNSRMSELITKVLRFSTLPVADGTLHHDYQARVERHRELLSATHVPRRVVDGAVALGVYNFDPLLAVSHIRFPHLSRYGNN